jgi:hypothetical protein
VKPRRWAEWWCEWKGGRCYGRWCLGWHVPRTSLGFAFCMTSDRCSGGAARGKGGAVHGASLAGSMVARASGVAAATMVGWESSKVGSDV